MIKIGDTLMLEPIYSDKDEKYKCKLVETTTGTFYIDYPINVSTHRTVFLMDGTELKASFVGTDGAVYMFETEVIKRLKREVPMIALTYPGKENLIKIQRRKFVRIETSVDCAVHTADDRINPFVTVTEDISAGGAAIILPPHAQVKEGLEFIAHLVLPLQSGESSYVKVKSKIIRIIEKDERKVASIEFIDIQEQDRRTIIRFCFDRQLAMRKKEMDA